jgi:hypothetical protein
MRYVQAAVALALLFLFAPTSKAQTTLAEEVYNCVQDATANGLPSALADAGCYFEVYVWTAMDSGPTVEELLDWFESGGFQTGTDQPYDPYDEYVHQVMSPD